MVVNQRGIQFLSFPSNGCTDKAIIESNYWSVFQVIRVSGRGLPIPAA